MAKDERLYGKFTLDFADNPKILPLSDSAFRCLVEATLYSRRMMTDGFLATRLAVAKWGLEPLQELATNDPSKPSILEVDGGWIIRDFSDHQDTKAEIEARRARNAVNGSLGGKARAKRLASDLLSEIQAETETETETTTSNEVVIPAIELFFDDAYSHWPKKVERKQALERFKTAARRMPTDELVRQIIRFGDAYTATTEKRFVPALGVWLSHERWTDELPTAPSSGRQTPMERARQTVALADRVGEQIGISA